MRKIIICLGFVLAILTSCEKYKKMENKTKFSYQVSVTAPREYPIEVYLGYLSTGKDFITTVPIAGVEDNGWGSVGSGGASGGSTIPGFLDITWLSYAEKKFWKLETELPTAKILALFQKGFIFKNESKNDTITQETYDQIIIGTAPGGIVVVWLDGGIRRVEVGRYQATETVVDRNKFYRNSRELSQEEFYEEGFEIDVPKETQEKIKREGIPYGLWDTYRKKFNWHFRGEFYKEGQDKVVYQNIRFFNGEHFTIYEEELDKKEFMKQALPRGATLFFKDYLADVDFDEKEIFDAFKIISTNHPDKNIEIEVRPAFMYKSINLTVKCEGEEIPLKKTEVKMWKRQVKK